MMRSDEAIVLGSQALGEADVIVTWIGSDGAKVRGVARAARRSRQRFGGALEPMNRVTVQWVRREGRDLQRVERMDLVRSYAAMQADPVILSACAVLSELSDALTREGDDDARVFRLLEAVLEALAAGADPVTMVRYAEYWLLRLHGLLPEFSSCSGCGTAFDRTAVWWDDTGALHCSSCSRSAGHSCRRLDPAVFRFLDAAAAVPPLRMESLGADERCGGVLEVLLRGAIEGFLERRLKTYRHLNAALRG